MSYLPRMLGGQLTPLPPPPVMYAYARSQGSHNINISISVANLESGTPYVSGTAKLCLCMSIDTYKYRDDLMMD